MDLGVVRRLEDQSHILARKLVPEDHQIEVRVQNRRQRVDVNTNRCSYQGLP